MLCIRAHPTGRAGDARHGERWSELVEQPGERGAGRARGRGVLVGAHVGALVDAQLHPALEGPREVDRVRLERELQALFRARCTDDRVPVPDENAIRDGSTGAGGVGDYAASATVTYVTADLLVGTMRTGHDAGQRHVL